MIDNIPEAPKVYIFTTGKNICKTENVKRRETCELIQFDSIIAVTQEGVMHAGAIKFNLVNTETGETNEQWVPKKLCSNLDMDSKTFYLWEVFAAEHLAHAIIDNSEA